VNDGQPDLLPERLDVEGNLDRRSLVILASNSSLNPTAAANSGVKV
jgi:hypothetical protein